MLPNIKNSIIKELKNAINKTDYWQINEEDILLEKTKNFENGHLFSNIPFFISSKYKKNHLTVGEEIYKKLEKIKYVDKIEHLNGFINFFISIKVFEDLYSKIIDSEETFGKKPISDEQYLIEIISANPNGNLHIGHIRNGIIGDTLSNLLEFSGKKVLRTYLVNDCGEQIKEIVKSVWVKYKYLLSEINYSELKDIKYNNIDTEDCAKNIINTHGSIWILKQNLEDDEFYETLKNFVVSYFITEIKKDLNLLNIVVDCWHYESEICSQITVQDLLAKLKKFIYFKDNALWFKTSDFDNNQKDDVIIKKKWWYHIFWSRHDLSHV